MSKPKHQQPAKQFDAIGAFLIVPGEPESHYWLPGEPLCLCGSHTRPADEQRASCDPNVASRQRCRTYAPFCRDCLRLNEDRWENRDGRNL